MTTVTLHGALGNAVGRSEWKLSIRSVREALRAIEAQTRKLYRFLYTKNNNIEYRILINGEDHKVVGDLIIQSDRFYTMDIIPVPAGAGNGGLWETIIGVVLIVVAVVVQFIPGVNAIADAAFLGVSLASAAATVGLALTLGGISQMMSRSPKLGNGPLSRSFNNDSNQTGESTSYLFSGAVNTTNQGQVVPIGYGRMIVGSQLVSFSLSGSGVSGEAMYASSDFSQPITTDVAFLQDSIWAELQSDVVRVQQVDSEESIWSYNLVQALYAAEIMNIVPATDTKSPYSLATLRQYLVYCSYIYSGQNGQQLSLSVHQAQLLYRILKLSSITDLKTASLQDILTAIANFYVSNPAPNPSVPADA